MQHLQTGFRSTSSLPSHSTTLRSSKPPLALAREVALRKPAAVEMLPSTFIQIAQEALSRKVDKRNFRREAAEADWIEQTGEERRGKRRPAPAWRISEKPR